MNGPGHRRMQVRGAATLTIVFILCTVLTLVALFAWRNVAFEQHGAANELRAARAHIAADSGLAWSLALLNHPAPIDGQCRPAAGEPTALARWLRFDTATAAWSPRPMAGAACRHDGSGWQCPCPAPAKPAVLPPGDAPGFTVQWAAGRSPGELGLLVRGCGDAACVSTALRQVVVAQVPGLAAQPAAVLTAGGAVEAGSAAVGFSAAASPDAGMAPVQAGGTIHAPAARMSLAPGTPVDAALQANTPSLAGLAAGRLFARHFRADPATWRLRQAMARASGAEAASLLRSADAPQLVWVDGDLELQGPLAIGSVDRPILVVASGSVRLRGPVSWTGLLHARDFAWDDVQPGQGPLRGAVVVERDARFGGAPDLLHDTAVLSALQQRTGRFVVLPGSWRDF